MKPNKRQRRQRKINKNNNNNKLQKNKKANMYSKIGGQIGSLLPVPGGKAIGKLAGRFFGPILAKLTGNGDYKMNTNPLVRNTLV